MTIPLRFSVLLLALMAAQAALGLLFQEAYRDVEWIRATWFGNDWVTLAVGAPLLAAAIVLARRGSALGSLLWLGMLGYAIYNYAFYLLGASLNVFFPVYVTLLVLSAGVLIVALARYPTLAVAASFRHGTPVRGVGAVYVGIGVLLGAVWLGLWAAFVFAGQPLPVEEEAFRLVAALDLALMVPALTVGGVLLRRRHPWGFVVASIAGVQGTLYLVVLSTSSVIAIRRGLTDPPGELPIWGALLLVTGVATFFLLRHVRGRVWATDPA